MIVGCFWDTETSGKTTSDGGIGVTTADMQKQATFLAEYWDFLGEDGNGSDDLWRMCVDGAAPPKLTWTYVESGDYGCGDGVGIEDLIRLTETWLTYCSALHLADGNGDGHIDQGDFAVLLDHWTGGQ